MLRKGIYDKVAAQVILQRYLDFYNSDEDTLVVNNERKSITKQLPGTKMQPLQEISDEMNESPLLENLTEESTFKL